MSELRAAALVLSQLLFTVFGAVVNIMLGITLRDLPNLASATFYVLLANVTVCNLLICTLVKTILSIYLGYAYLKDQYEVDLQFCPTFTFLHWTTIPVLPATLLVLSWHLYLASRRAEERSLNVPKRALSIFTMMIPLSTVILSRASSKKEEGRSKGYKLSKLNEEQEKRKMVKSVTMKDGPRPKQLVVLALIWIFSSFLGLERMLHLQMQEKGSKSREYFVRPHENSTKEISVMKEVDTIFCSVWSEPDSLHGFVVWIIFLVVPIILGPVLTSVLEMLHSLIKKCSRTVYPPTPSQLRAWVTIHLMTIVTMATYTLHLWLVERMVREQFRLDYFWGLLLKHLAGTLDIFIIPLIAIVMDPRIREGVGILFTAKKRGLLSKQNSVYSEYM